MLVLFRLKTSHLVSSNVSLLRSQHKYFWCFFLFIVEVNNLQMFNLLVLHIVLYLYHVVSSVISQLSSVRVLSASLCVSHHRSCCLGPRHLIFADGVTILSAFLLCDLIFGCFRCAVCALWGKTGGGAAARGPAGSPGQPGPSLPHQALSPPDGADRPIVPRLRTDGDRAEGHRLDLH